MRAMSNGDIHQITIINYKTVYRYDSGKGKQRGARIDTRDRIDMGGSGGKDPMIDIIPAKQPVVVDKKKPVEGAEDQSKKPALPNEQKTSETAEHEGKKKSRQTTLDELDKDNKKAETGDTSGRGPIGYVGDKIKDATKTILDAFKRDYTTIDIVPDDESYKNIELESAAEMLGYFTQKMEQKGFPWTLFKPGKGLKKRQKIGEYETLMRLKNGEPVVFQPRRILGLGISPPQFKGKDITGKEAKGKMEFKTGGVEKNFGEGVRIDNFAELKFLYELYNPDAQVDMAKAGEKTKAAKMLSFFTSKTLGSQYPWKLYKPRKGIIKKAWGVLKSITKAGFIGTFVGAMASLMAGGLVSVCTGALIGAGLGAAKAIYNARQGQEINAFEALYRLSKKNKVIFQEKKKHEIGISLPFPIGLSLGSISFYMNHGKGSEVENIDDLELFNKMQNQLPEKKKK